MNPDIFIPVAILCVPVLSAGVCLLMTLCAYPDSESRPEREVKMLLCAYFFCLAMVWISDIAYLYFPGAFIYINALCFLAMLLTPVIFYHFVYNITRGELENKFSPLHYLLPLWLSGALFVSSLLVPYDDQIAIIEARGEPAGGYEWGHLLYVLKVLLRISVSLAYNAMVLWRIYRRRQTVQDFSANEERASLRWLYILPGISILLLLLPAMMFSSDKWNIALLVLPFVLLAVFFHAHLAYNVVRRNFEMMVSDEGDTANLTHERGPDEKAQPAEAKRWSARDILGLPEPENMPMNRKRFEAYMRKHKPHLDPELRITDLLEAFDTNRTYLSSFINHTYGMNFNGFVNSYRLKELDKLAANPRTASLGRMKLIAMAGFGSYRSYVRAKNAQQPEQGGE